MLMLFRSVSVYCRFFFKVCSLLYVFIYLDLILLIERRRYWFVVCFCYLNLFIENNLFFKVGQCGIQVWQLKDKFLYIEYDNEEFVNFFV